MKQRIVTAVIALAGLFVVLFLLPPVAAELAIGALVLAGAWEWSGFLRLSGSAGRFAYVLVIAATLIAVVTVFWPYVEQLLLISLLWWAGALIWAFFFPTPIPLALRWIAGVFVLVPLYAALISLYRAAPSSLLFALLIVWVADSGAYFAGKFLGRVKLAPRISPGKTWEGVIGGLLAVLLLTLLRSAWVQMDLAVIVPFCLAVATLSIVGDLTVSMFKRSAGVKDSGTLFPGHGGVLDRIDSVAAAVPLFALGTSWVGLQ